ncbi:MAG: hypothetical protein FAF05_04150 [Epsilonproteobacteria bacterium]|nr:hypothetical protein [Campylobacterota bacterium]
MNTLVATVKEIYSIQQLHQVFVQCNDRTLQIVTLELDPKIQVGVKVKLGIKPTHLLLAKDHCKTLSITNQFPATLQNSNKGKILTTLKLQWQNTTLESIITTAAFEQLNIKEGAVVYGCVSESAITITEVLG